MSIDKNKYSYMYKKLGLNIKRERKLRRMSQEELAFKVGTARNYIGCIERAEKAPSLAMLFEIAFALRITVEDLFNNL